VKPKLRLGGVYLRLWASRVPLTLTLTALHSLDLGSSPIRESPLAILLAGVMMLRWLVVEATSNGRHNCESIRVSPKLS